MKYLALAGLLAIVGCAATGHLNTPSGKPEITVTTARPKAQDACAAWLIANGYRVESKNDYTLVGRKQETGFWRMSTTDDFDELSFSFVAHDSTTTIYLAKDMISKNDDGGETVVPVDNQDTYDSLQNDLQEIGQSIARP